MRWDGQLIDAPTDDGSLPGMPALSTLVRSVQTPEFAGITFHEVLAKTALNKVPGASQVPFGWTINPYRGCSHACTYCFARNTHTYLELDAGDDFDHQIVVKINVAEVLTRELRRPSWRREAVALGTNTDPYQRAEGRYRLMPGIITALVRSGTPFSVLTKGASARRDLPLLAQANQQVPVGMGVSIALDDEAIHRDLEPGTPTPRSRLNLVKAITDAGLPCQVLVAPILPMITDSDEQLDRLLGKVAAAGATIATVFALHLRPGAREWFWRYLQEHQPQLVAAYAELYRGSAYVLRSYAEDLARRVRPILRRHHLDGSAVLRAAGADSATRSAAPAQVRSQSSTHAPARVPAIEPTLF
jgi:DNA repair photolyase